MLLPTRVPIPGEVLVAAPVPAPAPAKPAKVVVAGRVLSVTPAPPKAATTVRPGSAQSSRAAAAAPSEGKPFVCALAAGARCSMVVTRDGGVYVWGTRDVLPPR